MVEMPPTGLIGVGLLGSAIAQRLIDGGLTVCGFDTNADQLGVFSASGGSAADDAVDVVQRCDTVLLSLPNSEAVSTLLAQLEPHLRVDQIVIDTSTGDPSQMVAIGESLARRGVHYVEAMVAGSSAQVLAGNVVLFIGGEDKPAAKVAPLLSAITATHFRLGPVGAASRFKLVHNLLLGLHRAVLAEGLTFAASQGFDPAEALRILQQTPAASAVMDTKGTRMVTNDFSPQARLSQHLKDVRLILTEAKRHDCPTPLSELHRILLERAETLGFGDADNSAIIKAFQTPATDNT